ncbi:MAG: P-II family nitrogen regulator [Bacillota bacterium]|nr:P-II family nitrogen regulator [Bacillota bacterium]
MKKIEAIIRPGKLSEVLDELNKHHIFGVTVTQVMGCGLQGGRVQYYRGNKYNINLLTKVKIEIVTKDACVEEIIDTIVKAARTGEIGDGKIFISDMGYSYRIRTGQQGDEALI